MFNAERYNRSCKLICMFFSIRLFCEIRIKNFIIGIKTGKERIAINVPLLDALDAIADIMLNADAKAMAPKISEIKKDVISITGKPEFRE